MTITYGLVLAVNVALSALNYVCGNVLCFGVMMASTGYMIGFGLSHMKEERRRTQELNRWLINLQREAERM